MTEISRLLRLPAVIDRVGLCKATIYKLISTEEFPKQVKLTSSGRSVAWRESEVNRWVASRQVSL
jgi:prophage regulatory protein